MASLPNGSGGANGSIQYELELDRPENKGLKKAVRTLREAMDLIRDTPAANTVSFADMVYLAAAFAVEQCGGPVVPLRVGRVDATDPQGDPTGRLPREDADVATLRAYFTRMGFNDTELVVLSGAHTIGGKGFGDPTGFDNQVRVRVWVRVWVTWLSERKHGSRSLTLYDIKTCIYIYMS